MMRCGQDRKWSYTLLGCWRTEWTHLGFFLVPSQAQECQEELGSLEPQNKHCDKLRQKLASSTEAEKKNERASGKYSFRPEKSQLKRTGRRGASGIQLFYLRPTDYFVAERLRFVGSQPGFMSKTGLEMGIMKPKISNSLRSLVKNISSNTRQNSPPPFLTFH